MEIKQDIFVGSTLNLDTHHGLLNNQLTYLLNGDISDFGTDGLAFVQNQRGNELCLEKPGYEYRGAIKLDRDQFAIFYKIGISYEIGILSATTCAYIPIINAPCLNLENMVTGVFNYADSDRHIYWRDGLNPLRYLNLDKCAPLQLISDCKDCEREYGGIDCESMRIFKNVPCPRVELHRAVGNLPNGSYQVAIAYVDKKTRYSQYYIYPEIVRYHSNNQANNGFAINLEILDCITGFENFEVVLISNVGSSGVVAQRVGIYSFDTTNILISELDDTSYVPVSLETLFSTKAHYTDAKFLVDNGEMLVLGAVREHGDVPYQIRANEIGSEWVVRQVLAKEAHKHKGFMRGEIYPFHIRGVYGTGERTKWFHIPSDSEKKIRDKSEGYWNMIQAEPPLTVDYFEKEDGCDPTTKKYWELYDTASVTTPTMGMDPNSVASCVLIQQGVLNHFAGTCNAQTPAVEFDGIYNYFEISVLNAYCEQVPTDQDIIVSVIYEFQGCGGPLTQETIVHTLPAGQSSFLYPYVNYQLEDCGDGHCYPYTKNYVSMTIVANHLPTCTLEECVTKKNCNDLEILRGNFAHWESTLTYPDNPCVWGQRTDPSGEYYSKYALSCQNIRYHKFPENCLAPHHSYSACGEQEYAHVMDIEFSNIQPFVDKDGNIITEIVGYEIGVGDRQNHKSILHKGLINNMFEETLSDCKTGYYANYPFNDLNADPFLGQHAIHANDTLNPWDNNGFSPVNDYSRDRFQYISPDVSYIQDDSGSYMQIYEEENGLLSGQYSLTPEFPKVTFMNGGVYQVAGAAATAALFGLSSPVGFAIQAFTNVVNIFYNFLTPIGYSMVYHAKSVYSKYNCSNVIIGNRRRKIEYGQYMLPIKQYANGDKVNNFQREDGLYLKLHADVLDPAMVESSRFRLSDNFCKTQFGECSIIDGRPAQTSSYYVGVKTYQPNQYGSPESHKINVIQECFLSDKILIKNGGDIYITKHRSIRKFPFFTTLPIGLPDKSSYTTSAYYNVWYPRYWMDTDDHDPFTNAVGSGPFGWFLSSFTDSRQWSFEGVNKKIGQQSCDEIGDDNGCRAHTLGFRRNGKFYSYVVGESHFWCESEFIGDYREINEIPESNIDRDEMQKINYRTIQYPELFLYNLAYNWKGLSFPGLYSDKYLDCCDLSDILYKNRVAYSQKSDPLSAKNNWLNFRADSFQQFDLKAGELTVLKSMDTYNLFIGFEDASYITQADDTLYANTTNIFIGSPNIFERRLKRLSDDLTGYGGCVDPESVIPTRYGIYWFDRKRKKFLNYSDQLHDVTTGMQRWFNSWMGNPIIGTYDNYSDNIYYTSLATDTEKSWSLTFKPKANGFVSFNSFLPDGYLSSSNNFFSVKGNGIWRHNADSFQNYYGKVEKFEIGININHNFAQSILQSVEIHSEWYTTVNVDGFEAKVYDRKVFFDEAFVYNHLYTTGSQKLLLKEGNNENHYLVQNQSNLLEVSHVEDFTFRMNGFRNMTDAQPTYYEKGMNHRLQIPTFDNGLIRGKWYNLHLINNKIDTHKILVQLNLTSHEQVKQ